jgi:hypothetical protein
VSGSEWTVSKLIEERMSVRAYCDAHGCSHRREVNLEALRDRLGPDAPAMAIDLAPRLKCTRCGSRNVSLIYSPDMRPSGWQWKVV